ncbi:MAG TPA: hypothetical protein VN833_23760, partial [Candidatus Acidoferrales bacterium]|nr:hypothetical protein [Candidatus Acidoferrales bacterium]
MKKTNLSRRVLLQRAVPALAGSFAALSSTHLALAKEKSPLDLPADPAPDKNKDNKDNEKIWSGEYWAKKGDLALYIFR